MPRRAVASLNTHDMFPFAGFLRGDDIIARVETGQLDPDGARRQLAARHRLVARLAVFLTSLPVGEAACPSQAAVALSPWSQPAPPGLLAPSEFAKPDPAEHDVAELLSQATSYLARSQAALVMINLEDLLLETRPQNLPGTGAELPNWRRKIATSLEVLGKG